jgi:hypothetical protein
MTLIIESVRKNHGRESCTLAELLQVLMISRFEKPYGSSLNDEKEQRHGMMISSLMIEIRVVRLQNLTLLVSRSNRTLRGENEKDM